MSFWRGERLLAQGPSLVTPFVGDQIDCNAYVLRMGDRYFRTSDGVQIGEGSQKKEILSPGQSFVIPPGQFAYLLTKETVSVPANAMAFISMRTQLKWEGLLNVSGFHVDPGYTGKLLFAVFNAGPSPVPISENDLLFKIWFCDLDDVPSRAIPASTKIKRPDEGLNDIDNKLIHGMTPPIVSLQGLAAKQRDYEKALGNLQLAMEGRFEAQKPTMEFLTFVWRALTIGLWTAIIGAGLAVLVAFAIPIASHAGSDVTDWLWPGSTNVNLPKHEPIQPPAGTQTTRPTQ